MDSSLSMETDALKLQRSLDELDDKLQRAQRTQILAKAKVIHSKLSAGPDIEVRLSLNLHIARFNFLETSMSQ